MANLNPRTRRIPPRAEELVRYINDTTVYNFRAGGENGAIFNLPDTVALAFMIATETGTIAIRDYSLDVAFVTEQ